MSEFIKEIIATILMLISLGGWSFIISRLAYISGNTKGFSDGYDEPRKIIDELEKIKSEIGEAYPYFDSADVHWGFNICRDILDNHIKELKGENNE